jgi:hypothetical protein
VSRASEWAQRSRREAIRKQDIARAVASARPFYIPPCSRCRAPLGDSKGNPRWDIVGRLKFVCLGGCAVDR